MTIKPLLLSLLVLLFGCSPVEDSVELSDGWSYRSGDSPRDASGSFTWLSQADGWTPIQLPNTPPVEGSMVDSYRMWMRITLPAGEWRDPALMLDPLVVDYEAYLDGEHIDAWGDLEGRFVFRGVRWRMLLLPPMSQPRVLHLRFRSPFWLVGIRGHVFIGSHAAHQRNIMRADFGRVAAGFIALLVALVSLLLAVVSPSDRRLRLSFAAYAWGIGGYSIYYTKLRDLFIDAPLLWDDIYRVSIQLAPVGIAAFTAAVFGPGYRGVLDKIWKLQLAIAVPHYLFAYTLGYRSQRSLLLPVQLWTEASFRFIIFIIVVAIIVIVGRRAIKRDRDALIFVIGIAPTAISTTRDVFAVMGLVQFNWDSWSFVGTLTFLAALVLIVQRRHDARVRRYAEDKARMLKDLHDGIGGITSNIGLLAEVAARDASSDKRMRLVEDIAELSREGMAEMRSLLDSLDEEEVTWTRLAAQLRHLGRQALHPHEVAFELESEVDSHAIPPTSFAYVHIVRIYREALANVVKHAAATRVSVTFRVSADNVELTVADDGVGIAEQRKGRGLDNMRARATELGGEVSFSAAGSGGSVALLIPLPLPSSS